MQKNLKLEIESGAKDLVKRIREYSRSQVELWQQVPFLSYLNPEALTAFRKKYSGDHADISSGLVFADGYWPVGRLNRVVHFEGYGNRDLGTYVDLETGVIVERGIRTRIEPAKTDFILSLAANIQELNAAELVTRLKLRASKYSEDQIRAKKEAWSRLYNRNGSCINTQYLLDTIKF